MLDIDDMDVPLNNSDTVVSQETKCIGVWIKFLNSGLSPVA